MRVELAREFYFREFDGKAQQDARMGIFVALLSALGGAVAFLLRSAWPPTTRWHCASLLLSSAALVLFGLAVIWVFRATLGFRYEKIPSPENLLTYWRNLNEYHEAFPGAKGSADGDFDDYLLRHLASAGARNARNNLARSARYYDAARFLLGVVVLSALAALFLALSYLVPFVLQRGV